MGDVHAVADDEQVGAGEADVIGLERLGELARLVEKTAMPMRLAPRERIRSRAKASVRPDSRMSSTSSTSRPATSVSMSRSTRDLAGGNRPGAIARQGDELDLRRHPGVVEGADQVGGEDEAALEDRDDEQVPVPAAAISSAIPAFRAAIDGAS